MDNWRGDDDDITFKVYILISGLGVHLKLIIEGGRASITGWRYYIKSLHFNFA